MSEPLYAAIAGRLAAMERCRASGDDVWLQRHGKRLRELEKHLPSGSGLDGKVTVCEAESTSEKIVIAADFHHMDESGFYSGWTQHKIVVRPSLVHGFLVHVTGRDRNDIKEYLGDIFSETLGQEVTEVMPVELAGE